MVYLQENVRSTTHRRGRTWKPLGGSNFSQSTSTPSSLHCFKPTISEPLLEQVCADVRRGLPSTLRPSLPSPCLSLPLCIQRPATGVKGAGTTPWHAQA